MASISWTELELEIFSVIDDLGFKIVINHQDGTKSSTKGVWGSSIKADTETASVSFFAGTTRNLYVRGKTSKVPQVGDDVIAAGVTYGVKDVQLFQATPTVIAHKLVVEA